MTPEPFVTITTEEVYGTVQKLDKSMDKLSDAVENLTTVIRDHASRLTALEESRWPRQTIPLISTLIALAAIVVTVLVSK